MRTILRLLALLAPILLLLAAGCTSGSRDAAKPPPAGPALIVYFTDN